MRVSWLPWGRGPHLILSMKRIRKLWIIIVFLSASICSHDSASAQENFASLPDSPSHVERPTAKREGYAYDRDVSWRSLPKDFLHDQKGIWLFPTQLAKGRHWIPTLVVVGGTAGLIYADPHVMPYFRDHAENLDDLNDTFDPLITTAEVVALPAALLTAGYIRHDSYQVDTAILCAEAYADSAVVNLVVKAITRRERPSDVPVGSLDDTFFNAGKSPFKGSSFPSGHAAGAFSVATVVSGRYAHHRWVPWLAYGMATAISLSRITSNAHFPSDVFLGASLGYSITRFQVLRPR